MELCSSYHLRQLLHVGRFDVNNIETLILYIEIPEVYSQIVTADEGLPIAIDRDAIDVVGMGVCVCSTRYSGNNSVMVCHARQFQRRSVGEGKIRIRSRRSTTATKGTTRSEIMGKVVFGYYL